jgi:endonuclease/exonuclease/phosphatase family metal-dependent hydrolase
MLNLNVKFIVYTINFTIMDQCQCYKNQKDKEHQCPLMALSGSIYCGKHQKTHIKCKKRQIGGGLDLNVLTYNISWEAMEGKQIDKIETYPICFTNPPINSCLNNIAVFIATLNQTQRLDFIGLQEASRWNEILQKVSIPWLMPINHGLSIESQVTLYDGNKYRLDSNICIIRSYMLHVGRPFTIVFLDHLQTGQKFAIINIHADHKQDFLHFEEYLYQTLHGDKKEARYSTSLNDSFPFTGDMCVMGLILLKLEMYHIIMMGDLNMSAPEHYIFLPALLSHGRPLHSQGRSIPTCNDAHLQGHVLGHCDHILTSSSKIQTNVIKVLNASDHLPRVAHIIIDT